MKQPPHALYHTTAVYRGKSYVTCECVTGRLSFLDKESKTSSPRGAVIAVITPRTETTVMTMVDNEAFSAVAAVFIGEHPSEALCAYAGQHGLPLLILGRLSEEHNGRVAILDSRTATLFVDPDLDTLTRYARALRMPHGLSFSPILLSCSHALPLFSSPHTLFRQAMLLSGDTLSLHTGEGEDSLFETLQELSEEHVGTPWILPVRVYGLDAQKRAEWLREQLRALLRAAVFAPFSLLLEGLFCADEVTKSLEIFEEVCRELTQEGREYNRCLPVGIAVESFLLLHELGRCPSIDYACLDWDRLLRAALPPFAGKAPSIALKDAFCALLRDDCEPLSLPLCARTVHMSLSDEWPIEAMRTVGIQSLFVPSGDIPSRQEWNTIQEEQ